jgi:hypothetical protein
MTTGAANERLKNQIAKDRVELLGLQERLKTASRFYVRRFPPTKTQNNNQEQLTA